MWICGNAVCISQIKDHSVTFKHINIFTPQYLQRKETIVCTQRIWSNHILKQCDSALGWKVRISASHLNIFSAEHKLNRICYRLSTSRCHVISSVYSVSLPLKLVSLPYDADSIGWHSETVIARECNFLQIKF